MHGRTMTTTNETTMSCHVFEPQQQRRRRLPMDKCAPSVSFGWLLCFVIHLLVLRLFGVHDHSGIIATLQEDTVDVLNAKIQQKGVRCW
jgi:hypothetical protein